MSQLPGPNSDSERPAPTDGAAPPDAAAPRDTSQSAPGAVPARRHTTAMRAGAGLSAAGGITAGVGTFLPLVVVLAVVSLGCRAPALVHELAIYIWTYAPLQHGWPLALSAWLVLVAAPLITVLGFVALARPYSRWRARIVIACALAALVDIVALAYIWTTGVLDYPAAEATLFRGFGAGLWVMLAGFLCAIIGGAILHGAIRPHRGKVPLPEAVIVAAGVLGLLGTALGPAIIQPPPLPAMSCQRSADTAQSGSAPADQSPSSSSLYVTTQDAAYAVRASDHTLRWVCHNAFGGFQTSGPPAVADGMMFVSALDGTIFGMRTSDGAVQWRRFAGGQQFTPIATPVVANGIVYAVSTANTLIALRSDDGTPLWSAAEAALGGIWQTPLVADGEVFIQVAGTPPGLDARDARTGELLWHATMDYLPYTPYTSRLAVSNGVVFIDDMGQIDPSTSSAPHYIVARAARTGTELWRFKVAAGSVVPPIFIVADGVVYAAMNSSPLGAQPVDAPLYALRARDGTPLWSFNLAQANHSGNLSALTYAGGTIYATVTSQGSVAALHDVYALDAGSGKPLWHTQAAPQGPGSGPVSPFSFPRTVVTNGALYLLTADGQLLVFDSGTGSRRWEYDAPLEQNMRLTYGAAQFLAQPPLVVLDDIVYLSAGNVFALDARNGTMLWTLPATQTTPFLGYARLVALPLTSPVATGP